MEIVPTNSSKENKKGENNVFFGRAFLNKENQGKTKKHLEKP